MVDFNRLRRRRTQSTPVKPSEIFLRLPKSPGIDDLWQSQAEALEKWFGRRDERDIVIKLNTGGGKTLVGLLIGQSIINESGGPVLYLCPTTQLRDQTIRKAQEYGIQAVPYVPGRGSLDARFLSGQSVMVSTYNALFNGLSLFGIVGGTREVIPLQGLILDDAHTAFSNIRDAFTISVESEEMRDTYDEITQLFRGDFGELGKQGTFDDVVAGQDYSVMEVPYWSWQFHADQVRQLLGERAQEDFPFVWPLLRDGFALCHALISNREFTITPLLPMVDMFPSFAECPNRIYMSATVADDSSIIRTFDADLKSMSQPITPASLAGVGERMILVPGLMALGKTDRDEVVPTAAKWVTDQRGEGAVILSPSGPNAAQWKDIAEVREGDDVALAVDLLVSRQSNGPFAFANRYDGIDLPKDSCRLLVLSGLPRGSNTYDLFRATVFEGSATINTTIAQRVEQGMGRGTRGAGDHCVVVLVGNDLVDWISRTSNLRLLTSPTRTQLGLGIEVSGEISDPKQLGTAMKQCLDRDPDWTEYHAESLADAVADPLIDSSNLNVAAEERRYFRLVRDGYYEKAIGLLLKFANENPELDNKVKGWLYELAARAAVLWQETDRADELQRNAYSLNRYLFRPRVAIQYETLRAPSKQSEGIIDELLKFEQRKGIIAYLEQIVSLLTQKATSNQFEESLKNLGDLLGFTAQRPEKEFGIGPDVLWLLDENKAFILEAKSRKKKKNALTKVEHGQLLSSEQWFIKEYADMEGYKVSVHPNEFATNKVTPDDCYVLTLDNLATIVSRVRELMYDLSSTPMGRETLLIKCDSRLSELNLTPSQLTRAFLKPLKCVE